MNHIKTISTAIFMGVLTLAVGCSDNTGKVKTASTATETTGEYLDDAMITTKVKAEVLKDSALKSYEINVETYKGVVQLNGFVSSEAEINKAAELTRSVKGVTSVKNDIRIKTS